MKLVNLLLKVIYTKISVMENTIGNTHYFQDQEMLFKFKFILMTLKHLIH